MSAKGADFSRADLQNARLAEAKLQDADFSLAQLAGANLREANLSGARLFAAKLIGTDITGAKLVGADLTRANLCKVIWDREDVLDRLLKRQLKADFSESNWWDAEFWEWSSEGNHYESNPELVAWLQQNFPTTSETFERVMRWAEDPKREFWAEFERAAQERKGVDPAAGPANADPSPQGGGQGESTTP